MFPLNEVAHLSGMVTGVSKIVDRSQKVLVPCAGPLTGVSRNADREVLTAHLGLPAVCS